MKAKILMLASLAALVAVGCSKDQTNEQPGSYPADDVIRVATTVSETRAGMTTENLSNMGFFVVNSNSETYTYKNVKMTYASSQWSPETVMLWQSSSQQVNINAYSPYVAGATDRTAVPFSVQTDQSVADNVRASDFVYDKHSNFTPSRDLVNGCVPLTLEHVLSKLVVTIKLGTEFNVAPGTEINPITDVTVNGTKVSCMLNFDNNAFVEEKHLRGDAQSITMYPQNYTAGAGVQSKATAMYECILLPQTMDVQAFKIDIFISGKGNYKYISPIGQSFAPKKLYSLSLTVGKDQVTAGNITMNEWVPGNGQGGNYETE